MSGSVQSFRNHEDTRQTLTGIARRVSQLLEKIQHGTLSVQWPDGQLTSFGHHNPEHPGLHALLHLHNDRPLRQAMKSGDIGFAESFIAGDWTTPDLSALLQVLIANRRAMEDVIYGHWLGRLLYRLRHLLNRNTRSNSAKNIHAHYDLGNAFYQLWLDPTMNYSSALFDGDFSQDLSTAQNAKVWRALQEIKVTSGQRVMEIGCGWGALAQMGAEKYGAHMSGVTLSHEQLAYAQARMQAHGLSDKSDLRLQDYRDIEDGKFDAVCSIEMMEAVGLEYWDTYFETIYRILKQGGRACVQTIVIDDALFERYVKSTDFIQQYIFPGGCLPSASEFKTRAQNAGLHIINEKAFGLDYAETLRRWRVAFLAQREQVLQLGFDDRFTKIWEFYLNYCEAAFEQGNINVVQYTLYKI
jgi:cyclopropane-fatty-acyl-phospholipid synthase